MAAPAEFTYYQLDGLLTVVNRLEVIGVPSPIFEYHVLP